MRKEKPLADNGRYQILGLLESLIEHKHSLSYVHEELIKIVKTEKAKVKPKEGKA